MVSVKVVLTILQQFVDLFVDFNGSTLKVLLLLSVPMTKVEG